MKTINLKELPKAPPLFSDAKGFGIGKDFINRCRNINVKEGIKKIASEYLYSDSDLNAYKIKESLKQTPELKNAIILLTAIKNSEMLISEKLIVCQAIFEQIIESLD